MSLDTRGLERMGLSRAEATVYLTIMHGGRLNLASLSDKSGINRTTLYAYLNTLLRKGYIKETILGKRTFYIAESPQTVLTKYRQSANELESNLKQLMSVFTTVKQTPAITMYQEKEGLQDLYRDIVEKANYIKSIFSPDRYYSVFNAKDDNFVEAVKQKGIIGQVLIERSESAAKRRGHKEDKRYSYRYLERAYSPSVNMIVFNGHVALISFESLFGVLITNDLIAQYHEDIFDKEWKRAA
jgi:sugar-specific transcriptional regulator TrmB